MLKKILIGIGVLVLAFVLYSVYVLFIAAPASPPDVVSYSDKGLEISVEYSRPYKKDRLIFGSEADGALQPYGVYWRLGANAATEITFSKDVLFGGKSVKAGSYRMYAIPGKEAFEIRLNSELDVFFGVVEADPTKDIVSVMSPVAMKGDVTEQFTISFNTGETGILINFDWDTFTWSVPIVAQQ